jgi:hypothetical protein
LKLEKAFDLVTPNATDEERKEFLRRREGIDVGCVGSSVDTGSEEQLAALAELLIDEPDLGVAELQEEPEQQEKKRRKVERMARPKATRDRNPRGPGGSGPGTVCPGGGAGPGGSTEGGGPAPKSPPPKAPPPTPPLPKSPAPGPLTPPAPPPAKEPPVRNDGLAAQFPYGYPQQRYLKDLRKGLIFPSAIRKKYSADATPAYVSKSFVSSDCASGENVLAACLGHAAGNPKAYIP